MTERYFYYEPVDVTLCGEHMANDLARWFPETAEKCQGAMFNYEGYDVDELINALTESGELLEGHLKRLGTCMGPVDNHCESLH